ncbi:MULTISPECIES: hypothetical protein [unclassified Curtobacterium]|uniref:hypothetical protein n=1 Tax=unclassified Curtobacterium TaxID=257496 RepID=UPI000F4D1232|nr:MULTISPECIES: hypothetical protein [unclassified Curtobacterium]ROP65243.1 hypothetical protein EDF55_1899 [Curtobacterium sp. ZW137]TCK65506.1 hypothetical protein EDF27_0246 [Curtobacterium sp. PhB136]
MSRGERPRDREARALAEAALASLLHAADRHSTELVLIGGLVPEYLVDADDPHQGTNDVVEFLTDVADNLDQEIALPGTRAVSVKNLRGPGPALRDAHVASVLGERVRMVEIGGYLAAKGAAAFWRRAEKDLYDFAWVLVHAARTDPDRAQRAVAAVLDPEVDRDRWGAVLGVCGLFEDEEGTGTTTFVDTSLAAGSEQAPEDLALDAVLAVRLFRAGLQARRHAATTPAGPGRAGAQS